MAGRHRRDGAGSWCPALLDRRGSAVRRIRGRSTVDLPRVVADTLPTPETLARSAIARRLPETEHDFTRNVTLPAFRERAAVERGAGEGILAASVSDLNADLRPDNLEHGAFDPPAPRGETL